MDDLDSVLILVFSDTAEGAQIEMAHAFTPGQFPAKWERVLLDTDPKLSRRIAFEGLNEVVTILDK